MYRDRQIDKHNFETEPVKRTLSLSTFGNLWVTFWISSGYYIYYYYYYYYDH